jgi:hypothetical protein
MRVELEDELNRMVQHHVDNHSSTDTEMAGLQADAKKHRGEAAVGQSVADFTERPTNFLDYAQRLGGGGVSAPPAKTEMWKSHAEEGDRAIADLGARRKSEAGMAATQATAASAAEQSDPNSKTAQMYRGIITRMHPGMAEQLAGANAKQLATAYPWLEKFSAENNDLLQAKSVADAKAAAELKRDKEKGEALLLAKTHRAEDLGDRRANTAAIREQNAIALGMKRDEVKTKADADINDDVQKLGKELPGDVADFEAKYALVKKAIGDAPGDIPGVGPWDARVPTAMPEVLGGPNKTDLDVQKAAGQMLAAYQKLITGAGASDAERANLEKISIDLKNEKGFASGLESLKQAYDAKVKDVRARFRPEVVQRLEQGQKREGGGSAPERVTVSNGKETLEIDAGDVAEAERDGFKVQR